MNIRPTLQSSTFSFDADTQLNYEIRGSGQPQLLFLHGFGASLETWRDIEEDLSKKYTLYFLDLKGFGLSSKPPDGGYSLSKQAEIVHAFIRQNNLRGVVLIGHSYGGAVSLFTYLRDRSEHDNYFIQRLILIDPAAYVQDFPFFIRLLRTPLLNWFAMKVVPAETTANFTLRHLFHDTQKITSKRVDRYARFFKVPGVYNSFVNSAKQILPSNLASVISAIKSISIPTLIIWGEKDPVIPVANAYRLKHDIIDSHLVLIPDCGHVPHEEMPAQTVKAIVDFLESK